jgi:hypothetical protein
MIVKSGLIFYKKFIGIPLLFYFTHLRLSNLKIGKCYPVYIPTQVVTEYFRYILSEKYKPIDGLAYRSEKFKRESLLSSFLTIRLPSKISAYILQRSRGAIYHKCPFAKPIPPSILLLIGI